MVENLKRVREPAGWALLAVIVGTMLLNIVRLGWVLTHGALPVFSAFAEIANNTMSPTLVALQVALVCLCLFVAPPTPRAAALTRASAMVVTLGTLLTIVSTVIGLWASTGIAGVVFELLGGLLDIVLKLLGTIVLWVIDRAVRAGRLTPSVAPTADPELAVPSVADEGAPIWQPGRASGAVWRTAADAASGSPAASSANDTPPSASGPAAAGEPGRPDAAPEPYTAASAWAASPQTRPGAAEAMGWRRVSAPPPAGTPDA